MTAVAIKQDRSKTWALAGAAVAVWALLGGIVAFQAYERNAPEREWAETKGKLLAEAQSVVRAGLRDPSSAVFSEERVVGTGPEQRVCGLVNAKNGFGGYAGSDRYLVMYGNAFFGDNRPSEALWSRPEHPCDVF